MKIQEVELDHAFSEALERSPEMQSWLLRGGRFDRFAGAARLLRDEQAVARKSAKHWWKHWWCKMPDGTEGETDLFLVFEAESMRFALHIENKPLHGTLTMQQAAAYRPRAIYKANDAGWLNYSDFETLLLAPSAFLAANEAVSGQFDRLLSYEAVAAFAPLFAEAVVDRTNLPSS